jgi:hypothetical protein
MGMSAARCETKQVLNYDIVLLWRGIKLGFKATARSIISFS